MRKRRTSELICSCIALCMWLSWLPATARAQLSLGSEINYQGSLKDGGNPANGTFDFEFLLFDQLTFGNPVPGTPVPLAVSNVEVTDGVFTVALDFGAGAFDDGPRFLQVSVRSSGGGGFTQLNPRQALTANPYAFFAPESNHALSADSALNGVPIGTILPFAGRLDLTTLEGLPDDYLPCDGREVSKDDFPELHETLGFFWGGDLSTNFNVHDLRGRFLRGQDHGAGVDPDAGSRTENRPSGNQGDNIGSQQGDATRLPNSGFTTGSDGQHNHAMLAWSNAGIGLQAFVIRTNTGPGFRDDLATADSPLHTHSIGGGDTETRPKNTYVNWIIKAR